MLSFHSELRGLMLTVVVVPVEQGKLLNHIDRVLLVLVQLIVTLPCDSSVGHGNVEAVVRVSRLCHLLLVSLEIAHVGFDALVAGLLVGRLHHLEQACISVDY